MHYNNLTAKPHDEHHAFGDLVLPELVNKNS